MFCVVVPVFSHRNASLLQSKLPTSGRRRSDPEFVQNRQMSRERDRALWDP